MSVVERLISSRTDTSLPPDIDPERLDAARTALFAALGLPRSFFGGRRVLQIGGSAEAALQYSLWGANVTLVATEPRLGDYAERLFLRHRQLLRIEPQRALLADPAGMAGFGFVSCEEPLLYSTDPLRDLDILLSNLARDGVILVAAPEVNGWRWRQAMQRVVRTHAKGRDEMAARANEWFGDHVAATARSRGHDAATVLTDLFVIQRGAPVELSDLCRTFAAHGMTALGTLPSLRETGDGGADVFDYVAHRAAYRALESSWLHGSRDSAAPSGESAEDALARVERRIRDRDVDDALIAELRRGNVVDRIQILAAKQ